MTGYICQSLTCIVFFIFISVGPCTSQPSSLNHDSILIELNVLDNSRQRGEMISNIYNSTLLDSASTYFLSGLLDEISLGSSDLKLFEVTANNMKSRYLSMSGKKDQSLALVEKNIKLLVGILANSSNDNPEYSSFQKKLAVSYLNAGMASNILSKKGEAIEHYEKAMVIAQEMGNIPFVEKSLNGIGVVYQSVGETDLASEYLFKAVNLPDSTKSVLSIETYIGLGDLFLIRKDFEQSIIFFRKANELANILEHDFIDLYKILTLSGLHSHYITSRNFPKADSILNNLEAITSKSGSSYQLCNRYLAHAELLSAESKNSKALNYLDKAEGLIELNNEIMLATYYGSKAFVLKMNRNYISSRLLATKALALNGKIKRREGLLANYELLSDLDFEIGNYKSSVLFLKKFKSLNDSMVNEKTTLNQDFLSYRFGAKEKETELSQLRSVEIENSAKISQQRGLLVGSIVGFSLFSCLAFVLYRNNIRKNKVNELLNEKNNLIKVKSNQNEILLKEIHHRVKNNLQTISSLLYLQSSSISDAEAKEVIAQGQRRVESIALIHKNLYQRENLAGIEMRGYISKLVDNLKGVYGLDETVLVNLKMTETELDVDTAIPLGLIINELLTNVFKYAFQDHHGAIVSISFKSMSPDKFNLKIRDNGKGKLDSADGFGSQLVSLLTKQLEATFIDGNDNGYWCEISN